jgi:hypothetical protein
VPTALLQSCCITSCEARAIYKQTRESMLAATAFWGRSTTF